MADAFQQRGARYERLRVAAPVDQLLGILENEIRKRAPIQQRPQHAEQHSIDMPMRDRGEEPRLAERRAPKRLENRELCLDVVGLSRAPLSARLSSRTCRARAPPSARFLRCAASSSGSSLPDDALSCNRQRRRGLDHAVERDRRHACRAASGARARVSCARPSSPAARPRTRRRRSRFKTQRRPALCGQLLVRREKRRLTSSGQRCSVAVAIEARDVVRIGGECGRKRGRRGHLRTPRMTRIRMRNSPANIAPINI